MRSREPEIIDVTPGAKSRQSQVPWRARLPIIAALLKTMLTTSVPAMLAMYGSYWLVIRGMMGDYFAWLLLLIAAPIAFALSVIAVPINIFLLISLLSVIFGKAPPQRPLPTNTFGTFVRTVRQKENR